jgi:signal transduction histidine kinase
VVNTFDENDVTLLTIVADQLATSLEKVRLFEEIHQRTAELEALAEVSAALRAATTVDQIVSVLLHQVEKVGAAFSAIFLIDPESGDAVAQGIHPPNASLIGHRYQPGEGITGSVASTGEIRFTDERVLDSRISIDPDKETPAIHSAISLPLRAQEHVVGVMHVGLREKRRFSDEEIRLLTAMAEIAGSALYRAQVLQTLEQRVKERTRELAEANEQLKELDRLKSKFVSDVSHELRTPITNLSLYLDLIENGRTEKQAQYLTVLRKQTNRLVNFVEDILSLSRLELSRAQVEFALVDLNTIIEPIASAYLLSAEEAGLALISDLAPGLPPVYGERNQLAQIISILLANGINYTSAGHVRVHTYGDKEKSRVCLEVADTGMGIASSDQLHIFERFYRGERASQSNIPGTGLGLAILKEIVILHGGEIEVWSEVGVGSTFRVWLPV